MTRTSRTRRERSAGVIVFRAPKESTAAGQRRYLLLDYGRHWDYPKGHVKKGESDLDAAIRELAEETGITQIDLIAGFARPITYFFRKPRKGLVRKEVIFFLGHTQATKVMLSDEHVGYEFLPLEQALDRLTFLTARRLLCEANQFLEQVASR